MKQISVKLKNPPREYRAIPFWSWNDKLAPELLRWQVREMYKAGLGGYFMHARGGLETPYLSNEWMEAIEACIDEGKKIGMNSWCYDEEGWPSGFGGGAVTAMGDRYHVRWLEVEDVTAGEIHEPASVLGVYKWDIYHKRLTRIQDKIMESILNAGEKILLVRHRSNPYYVDVLNEAVTEAFLDLTHEKYYSLFGNEFGKAMMGFFTDEPQFARNQIPWSYVLPEKFYEKYGYDLVDKLPALFIECIDYKKFRYDFWTLVNELYVKSFGEQIYRWCEKHHCRFTGHAMLEESLFAQMSATAGVMPLYEYMHIPGMDWLGRRISSPITPKQVGSVASQLGKKFVLSEMFALCGWNVSFEELKWIAEWQYVNGVNLMCQHLEGYTLRGLRKRDYPPSLFYQQSWWEEYKFFNDYFARLGVLLTEGRPVVKVLLLHPLRSAWVAYDKTNNELVRKLDEDFKWATEALSGLHIDHHYGDETLMARYGRVEGCELVVGQVNYDTVILPSMITLDENTLRLLEEFAGIGGKVISLGDFPELCSGVADGRTEALKSKVLQIGKDKEGLYKSLRELSVPTLSISDGEKEIEEIHYLQRSIEGSQMFFMVNHSQINTYPATITLKGKGRIMRYKAESDETEPVACKTSESFTTFRLDFLPMQSYILLLEEGAVNEEPQPHAIEEVKLGGRWTVEEMDLNSLTLDYCSYQVDDGQWNGPIPVIKLMEILLNLKRSCDITLRFNFDIAMDLSINKELFLILEKAEEFDIAVNGRQLEFKDIGWWKDSEFKKVDIRPFVIQGNNEVIIKRCFYQKQKVYDVLFGENMLETEKNKLTYDTELESVYIVGDFGVESRAPYSEGERKAIFTEGPFVITDKPKDVVGGDISQQGLLFFAGTVKLSQKVTLVKSEEKRYILDLKKPDAPVSKVFINDRPVKTLIWAPYTVDVTDFIKTGDNKITIQLFSSNRNLLGPHHHVTGEMYSVGPSSFTDKTGWADTRVGCTDIWRERYCFVRFGV